MKKLFILFFLLCFSPKLWSSPEPKKKGEGENEFIKDDIAYKISENTDEVFVIYNYSETRDLDIPASVSHNGKTYSVIGIANGTFFESKVQSIHLPNTIRWIDKNSFCSRHIRSVNIPESVTEIGGGAFGFTKIDSVFIPHNVTSIEEGAFTGMDNLVFFQVDSLNPAYTTVDGVLYNKSKTTLIAYPAATRKAVLFRIPDGVTYIAEYAFYNAEIDSLFIPNSVISIGYCAFVRSKLSNVVISENFIKINSATFADCTNLRSIIIPNSVKVIESQSFAGCFKLTSVVIPENVALIRPRAFEDCISLDTIQIPDHVIIALESFHNTAWYNSQKEEQVLYLGKALYEYKEKYAKEMEIRMLQETEITVREGTRFIVSNAFRNCIGLSKITFPESLEYIGGKAFYGCKNLKSIHIPERVKFIYGNSFEYSGLRKIYVYWQTPDSVKIVRSHPIEACDVPLNIFSPIEGIDYFMLFNDKKCKLIVPKGAKEKYKQASVWNYLKIVERKTK